MSGQQTGLPPVSVIVASRDRLPLLRRALDAIWTQDYAGPVQVIVVFDGGVPTDAELPAPRVPSRQCLEIVENHRSPGVAGARNSALALTTADLVATCDDDDVWLPGRLQVQVAELGRHPESVAVGGSVRIVRGEGSVVRRAPRHEVLLNDLLDDRVMELHPSAMLYRRETLDRIGGWDETIPGGYAEDYDLLLRLARHGTLRLVEEVVADIHWNGGSFFFSRWQTIADALAVVLERYPEFATSPRGRARIHGQIAFAHAAMGQRRESTRWLRRGWADRPREPRLALTALVLSGLVSAGWLQETLHARGRGI
ncbi:glycosyltransferase family 2 protein [Nocardioides pacificus]